MADEKLVSYVKSCLHDGLPVSKIRAELRNAGWPKKDIEETIASASSIPSPGPAQKKTGPQSEKASKKKLYAGVIILILVVGAGTYYFISNYLFSLSPNQPVKPPGEPVCGDGNCTGDETSEVCPSDCPALPVNQNVTVRISQSSRTVSSGDAVNFDVEINSVYNLYGYQFDFEYDPIILQFSKATEGTFLNKNGQESTFCIDPKVSSRGTVNYVTIACTRLGAIGGVDGSGRLESVAFTAASSGAAETGLSNVKLVDSSTKRIILTG